MSAITDEPIEAMFTTDILFHAISIENACEGLLLPEPKGVYTNTELEPVMVDGQTYYTLEETSGSSIAAIYGGPKGKTCKIITSPSKVLTPITDINLVKTAVYDEGGNVIIGTNRMRSKEKSVSNSCFFPYRGIKIIKILVNDHIDTVVQYRKYRKNCYDEIAKHLISDFDARGAFQLLSGKIEEIYAEIHRDISTFIGNKNWNIYHTSIRGSNLKIERDLDFRVHCWEKEHGSAFRSGKYIEPSEPIEE